MENQPWNNRNISLDKRSLSDKDIETNTSLEEIRGVVKSNEKEARVLLFSFPDLDKEVVSFFETNTLTDGSVNISGLQIASDFFHKEGSTTNNNGRISTRGYDYICSLDASLTSVQKIKQYQDTILRAVESLRDSSLGKIERILILDYLKNGLITVFNSFVYQERLPSGGLDTSESYMDIRSQLMRHIEVVIHSSVDLILNKDLNNTDQISIDDLLFSVDNTVKKLISYHYEHRLPSFYVSRPEATHPMTIIGASLLCAERYKKVDTVVGVPSGGTEFAFTIKVFMDKLGHNKPELVLLPVSLHSLKQFSNESSNSIVTQESVEKYFREDVHSVLICDDNTSTGRTLQLLKKAIESSYPEVKIYCAVAEADTTRTQIDKDNAARTHIADKNIYSDSVNFLPVSRKIAPKVDLKEIIEKNKIISYYKNMKEKSTDVVDKVYATVMAHINEFGTDYSSFTEKNAVPSFHGTFLSNFYATPVTLNDKKYTSVEHAYQAAKFTDTDWGTIQQEAKDEITEALKLRGYVAPVVYSPALFIDEKMTAGNTKIIADILRKYGYVDKKWEDERLKIMIRLLLQKFESTEMLSKLEATGSKELIEGNTWGDTLWGVSEGHGRNMLGIVLMEIRKLGGHKIPVN